MILEYAEKFKQGEPGIYKIENDDYFESEGVSNSDLKEFSVTPKHYKDYRYFRDEKETAAQKFGKLAHIAILEPERYLSSFYVKPVGMRFSTKDGKEWQACHSDRMIITKTEAKQIARMQESVLSKSSLVSIIYSEGALYEAAIYANDSKTGLLKRGKCDMITKDASGQVWIVDLKTSRHRVGYKDYQKTISDLDYHRQAAFYIDLVRDLGLHDNPRFIWIAAEKAWPHGSAPYECDADSLALGKEENNRYLKHFKYCQDSNHWPEYPDEILPIRLPNYRFNHRKTTIDQ